MAAQHSSGHPFEAHGQARLHGREPVRAVLLMGVSGCGKSTTGRNLSRATGWTFRDADEFHPPANIAKMKGGVPLDDADRWPWLDAIGAWLDERDRHGETAIVSCSALKRVYRERLRAQRTGVGLVYLKGAFELINDRLSRRKGHFMPPALLASQFAALEEPAADEGALVVPMHLSPRKIVGMITHGLGIEVGGAKERRRP